MKRLSIVLMILGAQLVKGQPLVLHDTFDNNEAGWFEGEGDTYSAAIENGKYTLKTFEEGHGRTLTLSYFLDPNKDFLIEANFLQRDGSTNNGIGLLWGGDDDNNYHVFMIAHTGYYQVLSPEKREGLNDWKETKDINPQEKGDNLRVTKVGNTLHFYLNDKKVFTTGSLPFYGNKIGVINYTDMVLEMDDFIFRHDIKINLPENFTADLVKESLGPNVNSPYQDLAPKITVDGRMIMFSRHNSPDNIGGVDDAEDIWVATTDDGNKWNASTNMGSPVNDSTVNNLAAISADNNTLIFCQDDGFKKRTRTMSGWSEMEYLNMPKFDNESAHMEANLSADGRTMLFTVKLPGNVAYSTKDEKDIYVSFQDPFGKWSPAINLGGTVNSSGDEVSPFLAADDRTLYFATNGRPGYGSYDIFMTRRVGDGWTEWTEPVNLGPGINSREFDAYYTLSAAGDYAYMCSENSVSKLDLIRVKLPQEIRPDPVVLVIGKTLNSKTKEPVQAEIIFEDLEKNTEAGEATSDPASGSYRIALPYGVHYGVRAQAKGYFSVNESFELLAKSGYSETTKDLYLVPIEVGETILLNNVFFEQGRPILKQESYPELDRLVEILKENPTMIIDLAGHTDNRGTATALMVLSQNRVGAVKNYMVSKGIPGGRITGKGYGGTKPIAPNDTEENRKLNRRVEFKIKKK